MLRPRLTPATFAGVAAVVFAGAMFGFFYAWLCSTLWGLNLINPAVAIEAMQAMNDSVRNPVFFAGFFLTPVVTAGAALLAWQERRLVMSALMATATAAYLAGCVWWTAQVNLPLNAGLAAVILPTDAARAGAIWAEYSSAWQSANLVRTVVSGISLGLVGLGLLWSSRAPHEPAGTPGISQGTHSVPPVVSRVGG